MSIAEEEEAILRMASAYCCATKTAPSELRSLGDLMSISVLDCILQFILDRAGTERSSHAYRTGCLFCEIAASRVPLVVLKEFRGIVKAVNPPLQRKLAKRTIEKLYQIGDDVEKIQRIALEITKEVDFKTHINRNDAGRLATAAALELQLATGLSLGVIAKLPLTAIDLTSKPAVLKLPSDTITLGLATASVLNAYVQRGRTWFATAENGALFPGRKGAKCTTWMDRQIRETLASHEIEVSLTGGEISKLAALTIRAGGFSEAMSRRFRGTKVPPSRDRVARTIEGLEATKEVNRLVTSKMFKKEK